MSDCQFGSTSTVYELLSNLYTCIYNRELALAVELNTVVISFCYLVIAVLITCPVLAPFHVDILLDVF